MPRNTNLVLAHPDNGSIESHRAYQAGEPGTRRAFGVTAYDIAGNRLTLRDEANCAQTFDDSNPLYDLVLARKSVDDAEDTLNVMSVADLQALVRLLPAVLDRAKCEGLLPADFECLPAQPRRVKARG